MGNNSHFNQTLVQCVEVGMNIDSLKFWGFFLQVFLQPIDIVFCHAACDQEVSRPHGEHQPSVESCVIVFMRHFDAGGTEPGHIHDPVISENIILTCQDVGFWQ